MKILHATNRLHFAYMTIHIQAIIQLFQRTGTSLWLNGNVDLQWAGRHRFESSRALIQPLNLQPHSHFAWLWTRQTAPVNWHTGAFFAVLSVHFTILFSIYVKGDLALTGFQLSTSNILCSEALVVAPGARTRQHVRAGAWVVITVIVQPPSFSTDSTISLNCRNTEETWAF